MLTLYSETEVSWSQTHSMGTNCVIPHFFSLQGTLRIGDLWISSLHCLYSQPKDPCSYVKSNACGEKEPLLYLCSNRQYTISYRKEIPESPWMVLHGHQLLSEVKKSEIGYYESLGKKYYYYYIIIKTWGKKKRGKPQGKNHYSAFAQTPSISICGLLQLWSCRSFQMKIDKTGTLQHGKLKHREGYNIGL